MLCRLRITQCKRLRFASSKFAYLRTFFTTIPIYNIQNTPLKKKDIYTDSSLIYNGGNQKER